MSLPIKRFPLNVWRTIGWVSSLYLAVAAFIQLISVMLSLVPTGYLTTNTSLFISGFSLAVDFHRSIPTIFILIFGELLVAIMAVAALWFIHRGFEATLFLNEPLKWNKRVNVISLWHQAAFILLGGGVLSILIRIGQRYWLWAGVVRPYLTEESINYAVPSLGAILFDPWVLLFSAPTAMILLGIFIILFFDKLETPVPYAAEVTDSEDVSTADYGFETVSFEEPPATTGMLALQALPESLKEMPTDLKSMPLRVWKRFEVFVKNLSR